MKFATTNRIVIIGILAVLFGSVAFIAPSAGVQAQSSANVTAQNTSNASSVNTTVVFRNQTTNGSIVVIDRVTLPDSGFVAIHTSEYIRGPAPAEFSVIAVSQHLSAGTHRNVTIDISHAPPRNPPGLNRTRLNESQTLVAVPYRDSNDNQQFDFVRTYGENDTAFTYANGSVVYDSARVRVPSPEPATAWVVFRTQTIRNNTLVVSKARLPQGGFLVAVNESYQRTDDPLTSAVGISPYLSPGVHRNVTVRVLPSALNETQTVTILPSLDTNDNQRYDYVRTGGFQDTAYVNRTSGRAVIVNDTALVRVPGSGQQTQETQTRTPTTVQTPLPQTTVSPQRDEVNEAGDTSGGFGMWEILGILVVLVGAVLIIRVIR